MVSVIFNFEKRHLYFLFFGLGIIVLFGFAMAFGDYDSSTGLEPIDFGHSADELMVKLPDGTFVNLQDAVTSGEIGGDVWEKNGTNISYSAGNVKIGSGIPGAKLDVNGNLKVGNYYFDADDDTGDASGDYIRLTNVNDGAFAGTWRNFAAGNIWANDFLLGGTDLDVNEDNIIDKANSAAEADTATSADSISTGGNINQACTAGTCSQGNTNTCQCGPATGNVVGWTADCGNGGGSIQSVFGVGSSTLTVTCLNSGNPTGGDNPFNMGIYCCR